MAEVVQTVQPFVKKERPAAEKPYWVHIAHDLPSVRGRAVLLKLKSGKTVKLYPATIVTNSGINEAWLTDAEAKDLRETKGITYCVQKVDGVTAPAPSGPPRVAPAAGAIAGGVVFEADDPDKD